MKRTVSLNTIQRGYVLSTEYLIFATILVVGLLVGWVTLRDSINAELMDASNAIESSITYYYFNDPQRGTGPDFVSDTLEFVEPAAGEGTTFTISGDPPIITPSDAGGPLATSPTGSITTGLLGSEEPGFGAAASATGTVTARPGSESDGVAPAPSATGTVTADPGSESGGGAP